jgi:segregation and condensation protein A
VAKARYDASIFELLRAYADHRQRGVVNQLTIEPMRLFSVDAAIERLSRFVGRMPDWQTLRSFLPPSVEDIVVRRSAMASTFAASLELAKAGRLRLRQDEAFGPIYIRSGPSEDHQT